MTDRPKNTRALVEEPDMGITLSDGCRLSARVWVPEDAGEDPVPAILEYLPYRKNDGTAQRDATMQPHLAAHGYVVVRLDLRGHGKTDVGGGPFSIEDLAGDVVGVLDQLGIKRTNFVGSSLGAMAGMALAFDHRDRLSSLTFMASQGALPPG